MNMATTIEQAHEEDLGDVRALLERHGLPVDDANRMDALVARVDGRVVGAAGLELYADGAVLRSVVVDASMGLGQQPHRGRRRVSARSPYAGGLPAHDHGGWILSSIWI